MKSIYDAEEAEIFAREDRVLFIRGMINNATLTHFTRSALLATLNGIRLDAEADAKLDRVVAELNGGVVGGRHRGCLVVHTGGGEFIVFRPDGTLLFSAPTDQRLIETIDDQLRVAV